MAVLLEVLTWLRTTGVPIALGGLKTIGRLLEPLWEAESVLEFVTTIVQAIGEMAAANEGLVVEVSRALTMAAAASLLAGSVYLIWRNWTAIVKAIGKMAAAISREAMTINGKFVLGAGVELGRGGSDSRGPVGDAPLRNRASHGLHLLASTKLSSIAVNAFAAVTGSSEAVKRAHLWDAFQPALSTAGGTAAIEMISAPLLIAPAMATISADRMATDAASVPTMVF
jgi:hypothetical protein